MLSESLSPTVLNAQSQVYPHLLTTDRYSLPDMHMWTEFFKHLIIENTNLQNIENINFIVEFTMIKSVVLAIG